MEPDEGHILVSIMRSKVGKVLTVIVRRAERESRLERTQGGGGVNQIRRGCSYLRNKM